MNKILLPIVFLASSLCCFSQEEKLSEVITTAAEELAAEENDPAAAELFAERLYELADDPVRINTADENEISRLFFLSAFQVKALADYIRTSGRIVSTFEIANIPGFDKESAMMMMPFITMQFSPGKMADSIRVSHSLLANIIWKKSYDDNSNIGSPVKFLTKYKFSAGLFSGGFTAEKDQGEKLFQSHPFSSDFFSAHLAYKGSGIIRRIVIGDYAARFGLGSNTNSGAGTGLSLSAPGYLAGRNEIRPYTSADENNYFRGGAVVLASGSFELSAFISLNLIDATINESADSARLTIKSLYKTGYHNTITALEKRNSAREFCYGMNLSINLNNLRAGVTFTENRFSYPFVPDRSDPADLYDFTGIKNSLYTIYYNGLLKKFILFGEATYGGKGKVAIVQGVTFRPVDRMTINILYRNYSPQFISFHGRGPGAGSSAINEEGIYSGFSFEAAKYLFISGGSDVMKYPWLRYRCSSPSFGYKHELRVKYLPSDRFSIEGLLSARVTQTDGYSDSGIPFPENKKIRSARLQARYSVNEILGFTTRIDYKRVSPSGKKGVSLLQDFNIRFRKIPLTLWMRYCISGTDDYESGIYTWENDLINSFSIPVLYGATTRAYFMAAWKPGKKFEFRLKYGVTERNTSINTLTDPEVKVQFRIYI